MDNILGGLQVVKKGGRVVHKSPVERQVGKQHPLALGRKTFSRERRMFFDEGQEGVASLLKGGLQRKKDSDLECGAGWWGDGQAQ